MGCRPSGWCWRGNYFCGDRWFICDFCTADGERYRYNGAAMMDLFLLAQEIKRRARETGFDLAGIASADPSRYRAYFERWLAEKQAGQMHYLEGRFAERVDPGVYLPGAKSIICVGLNYHVKVERPEEFGRIAQYALGNDYHEVIKPRLFRLADWLRKMAPDAQTKCAVDTAPVMEKELAARAGI